MSDMCIIVYGFERTVSTISFVSTASRFNENTLVIKSAASLSLWYDLARQKKVL